MGHLLGYTLDTIIYTMNHPMKLLCIFALVNTFILTHGEMQDIDILGNHVWGRKRATFQAVVTFDVSPAIPDPETPTLSITFNAPVKNIKVYQFGVDSKNEDMTSFDMTYRYGGGFHEGNYTFHIQVKCTGKKETCPTQMDYCFVSHDDQLRACSTDSDGVTDGVTDGSFTDGDTDDSFSDGVTDGSITDRVTDGSFTNGDFTDGGVTDNGFTEEEVTDGVTDGGVTDAPTIDEEA